MIEVLYARYGGRYVHEVDDIEEAFGYIELGEDQNALSAIGIFIDGEPRVWDGYAETREPTDEERQEMMDEYAKAKEHQTR